MCIFTIKLIYCNLNKFFMKKSIVVLLSCLYFTGINAQDFHKNSDGDNELANVVEVKLNKSALYRNALQWASSNDPTCKKSIDVQDNENGSIVVKFELNDNSRDNSQTKYLTYKFRFSVKVDCKDNKYRRTILNPSVLVGADNNINTNNLSVSKLFEFRDELETAARISESDFQKILDWELEKVVSIIESKETEIKVINERLANIDVSKKEKKQLEYKFKRINDDNAVLKESLTRWNIILEKITKSVDKTLSIKDDF